VERIEGSTPRLESLGYVVTDAWLREGRFEAGGVGVRMATPRVETCGIEGGVRENGAD